MARPAGSWLEAIPSAARSGAFDIACEIWGPAGVGRFLGVGQESVMWHCIRMGAAALHLVPQAGGGMTTAERIARKCIVHDIGKPDVPGISDHGVWTQARRLAVRRSHTMLGGQWIREHLGLLPDAKALAWTAVHHHDDMPPPQDYRNLEPPLSEWCGDLHLVQGLDRFDAIAMRPYVQKREGTLTPDRMVTVALGADPRGPSPALEPVVVMDGWHFDLATGLGEIAGRST